MYYPLLKHANNEIRALKELKGASFQKVTPIIESKRIKVGKEHEWEKTFNTVGTYFKEKIPSSQFIYDFHTAIEDLKTKNLCLNKYNKNLVEFCIEKFEASNLDVIPCFNFDSPDWIINSVLDSNYNQFAIRVRCGEFQETFDLLVVNKIMKDLSSLPSTKTFILILDFFNFEVDLSRIKNAVNTFNALKPNKTVYLATSCPENASKAQKNSITLMGKREELINFYSLRHNFPELYFGDYTVRLKGEVLDGFNHNNSYIKIFYSSNDEYFIAKSELIKDKGEFTFHKVCETLVNSSIYPGQNFSFGDKSIKECADKKITIGDHQTPIAIGINHHIELTITQV